MAQKFAAILGTFIGYLSVFAIEAVALMLVYNKVAWEFNLPQFPYLVFLGAWYLLNILTGRRPTTKA